MLGLKNKNMNKITIFCLFTILFYVHEHSITSTTREASEILKKFLVVVSLYAIFYRCKYGTYILCLFFSIGFTLFNCLHD
jgi:hypothetical protein